MKMKWVIHTLLFLLITQAEAQLRIEQMPLSPIKSNTGFFVYGADNLKKEIPYSAINGNPYWNPEFMNAIIHLSDGKSIGPYPVRINIASNEINFRNKDGEELTAQPAIIQKIVIYQADSSGKIFTVLRND